MGNRPLIIDSRFCIAFGERANAATKHRENTLILNRYPGGPLLNPLGIARDIENAHDWKLKEIKNG